MEALQACAGRVLALVKRRMETRSETDYRRAFLRSIS